METDVMVVGGHRQDRTRGWLQLALRATRAALLAVSAGIHLDLYLTGYRSIPAIGWLFPLQVTARQVHRHLNVSPDHVALPWMVPPNLACGWVASCGGS